jgi:succinate dehydrogenase / fumarate reductase membrane anchor subunit
MSYRYEGSGNSLSFAWFFQRITGVVLFVQVLVHFYIAHNTWDSGHDWTTIVSRMSNPYMKMFYLVFVSLGLWHGLNGLWAVIRDYNMSDGLRKLLYAVILTVGICLGILGFITMLTISAP